MLPPLRERRDDLPALCRALLHKLAQESGLHEPMLDEASIEQIAQLPLPGNVRELENVLHRAIALGDGGPLRIPAETLAAAAHAPWPPSAQENLPPSLTPTPPPPPAEIPALAAPPALPAAVPADLQAWLDEQERAILIRALQDNGFNRTATAARLGISLRQIRYRIERLGIQLPGDQARSDAEG